jgi:hypothetical protein
MFNTRARDADSASPSAQSEPSWNFISSEPDPGAATALTENPELERYLVAEIARASRRRPLMKRLAHVEAAYAEQQNGLAPPPPVPPPLPPLSSSSGADPHDLPGPTPILPIDQLMEEFGETYTAPPPSADWLAKARRERRRQRARAVFAWLVTLAIGMVIVAITLQSIKG